MVVVLVTVVTLVLLTSVIVIATDGTIYFC